MFTFQKEGLEIWSSVVSMVHFIPSHWVNVYYVPNNMHHSQGPARAFSRARGQCPCHVVGMDSFKNTNSAQWKGIKDSPERQGSETLLKIQNEGCVTRTCRARGWEVSGDVIWPVEYTSTHCQEVAWEAAPGRWAILAPKEQFKPSFNELPFLQLLYDLIHQASSLPPLWITPFVKNKVHAFMNFEDVDCVNPKTYSYFPGRENCIFRACGPGLARVLAQRALLHRWAPSQVKARMFSCHLNGF